MRSPRTFEAGENMPIWSLLENFTTFQRCTLCISSLPSQSKCHECCPSTTTCASNDKKKLLLSLMLSENICLLTTLVIQGLALIFFLSLDSLFSGLTFFPSPSAVPSKAAHVLIATLLWTCLQLYHGNLILPQGKSHGVKAGEMIKVAVLRNKETIMRPRMYGAL